MNRERCAAIAAVVVLLLALAWWQTSDPQTANPGKPAFNGPVLRGLRAEVEQLAKFESFNVNPANPFLPYELRVHDIAISLPKPKQPKPVDPPTRPREIAMRPAVVINEPAPKPVVLPRLTPALATAPQCVGLIGGEDSQLLVVRMPGSESSVTLKVAGSVDGWTLVAIDNNNQARFTDPSGATQVFPIGDGDLAVAQTLVTPGSDAPSKPSKPGDGALIKDLLGVPKPTPPGQAGKGQGGQGGPGDKGGQRKPRRPAGQGPVPLQPAGDANP